MEPEVKEEERRKDGGEGEDRGEGRGSINLPGWRWPVLHALQ